MLCQRAILVLFIVLITCFSGDARAAPAGNMDINDGQEFTSERVVYINATLIDVYPVTQAKLSESPAFEDANWVAMRSPLPFQLSTGDGLKTVYALFRDSQGYDSDVLSDSIFLDTTAPVGTITINQGAVYTRDPQSNLAIDASDDSSVKDMMVSNKVDFQGAQWVTFKSELAWSLLPGNGARTVFVKFRDRFLHESAAVNDSIILDTVPPALKLTINSAAPFTNNARVSVHVDANENYQTESMIVTQYDSMEGLDWQPFQATFQLDLSPGDGPKTVSAKLRDAAGNEGAVVKASISLDTVPPAMSIEEPPAESDTTSFTINWSGSDFTSGIASYDIQVRDGTGPWYDWYANVNRTSALFTGTPDHNYSFRGRARDRAGNAAAFPENLLNSVYIWPRYDPTVSFTAPRPNATVSGVVTVTGTASQPDPRRSVKTVTICVDDGVPVNVDGTLRWKYRLDTTKLEDGVHILAVQSDDGERVSNETLLTFSVRNHKPSATDSLLVPITVLIVMMVAASLVAFFVLRRQRPAAYVPPPPERHDEMSLTLTPEAAAVTELTPEAKARIAAMIDEPVRVREKTDAEKQAAEMATREIRILTALSSLPRGLPPSLWGIEMEDLAARVVKAEREDTPDGDMLIKINNKWYYGDESNLGMFMQEYKKD